MIIPAVLPHSGATSAISALNGTLPRLAAIAAYGAAIAFVLLAIIR